MKPRAGFPVDGFELRGVNRNSLALWLIGILGGVVLASDIVVLAQWLLRDRPAGVVYVFAGAVLVLSTFVLAGVAGLAVLGVRRQRYGLSLKGLDIPRMHACLPWQEITAIGRRAGETGVEVFITGRREPIRLDLTDVPGGTVRFFAAARWYADQAGVDLNLPPAPAPGAAAG